MRDLRCTSAYKSPQDTYPSAIATTRASGGAVGSRRVITNARERYPRYDSRDACIKRARILLFAIAATANPRFTPRNYKHPVLK